MNVLRVKKPSLNSVKSSKPLKWTGKLQSPTFKRRPSPTTTRSSLSENVSPQTRGLRRKNSWLRQQRGTRSPSSATSSSSTPSKRRPRSTIRKLSKPFRARLKNSRASSRSSKLKSRERWDAPHPSETTSRRRPRHRMRSISKRLSRSRTNRRLLQKPRRPRLRRNSSMLLPAERKSSNRWSRLQPKASFWKRPTLKRRSKSSEKQALPHLFHELRAQIGQTT